MPKEQANIIEYLVCVIRAFARQFSLTNAKAYQYLRQYKGIDFILSSKPLGIEAIQMVLGIRPLVSSYLKKDICSYVSPSVPMVMECGRLKEKRLACQFSSSIYIA